MKISIEEVSLEVDEEIIIRCHEVNDDILKLLNKLKPENFMLLGYDEHNIHRVPISDVYYFESVDNKVFIYCNNKTFESKQKLYELEEICHGKRFFRASKSTIINLTKYHLYALLYDGNFHSENNN